MPENLIPSYELINSKTTLSSLLSPASGRQTKPSTAYTCMVPHACPLWLKHLSLSLALCLTLHPPLHLPSQWKAEKMDVFHFSRHRCVPAAKVKFEPRFHGSQTHKVFLEKKKKIHKGGQELCERMKLYFHQQQQAALSISELFSKKLVAVIFYFCFVAARSWQNICTFGSIEEKRNNLIST